jgi:hypothetical protein
VKVSELIETLKNAPPDAEVFSEYEGNISPIEADDIRFGRAKLLRLIEASPDRTEPYDSWYVAALPDDGDKIVRSCSGVLLCAGGSNDAWPDRLAPRRL